MGTHKVEAVEHTCDGCGRREYEIEGEPPMWIWIDWAEVHSGGGTGGKLEACTERCVTKAVKRRHEIEEEARRN